MESHVNNNNKALLCYNNLNASLHLTTGGATSGGTTGGATSGGTTRAATRTTSFKRMGGGGGHFV